MIKTFFIIIEKLILIGLIMLLYPMCSHGQAAAKMERYPVPKEVVREKIVEHISEERAVSAEDIKIGAFSYRTILLPNKKYELSIEDIVTKHSGKRSHFAFNFNMKNGRSRRVKIAVPIKVRKGILKLSRDFRKGDILAEGDIEEADDWVNYHADNLVSDVTGLTGKRFNRTVRADTILRKGMVAEEPLIMKGDLISIVAEKNGLSIRAKGMAHREGRIGSLITVVNLSSNKIIRARVLDKNSVMAEF